MTKITGIGFLGLSVTQARRSADWYRQLLDLDEVRETVEDDGHVVEVLLRSAETGMQLGLIAHRGNPGDPFSEFHTGLDHVEFALERRRDLDGCVAHLERLGIEHSGIKDLGSAAMVTFRDPDNIQLEFYWSAS